MRKLLLHFTRFGPYHVGRLRSAASELQRYGWTVVGMQVCSTDSTYAWDEIDFDADAPHSVDTAGLTVATALPGTELDVIARSQLQSGIGSLLNKERPEVVAIPGWRTLHARTCLRWARRNNCKTILMSETRHADGDRVWWKEALKSRIVRKFDAALVGAQSHADYLIELGLAKDQIFRGYNVIDDDYFATATQKVRANTTQKTTASFFLASNRFVEIKNLSAAITAYHKYQSIAVADNAPVWNLCLLGDGPLRQQLVDLANGYQLRVQNCLPWEDAQGMKPDLPTVYFPGFRQIDELPKLYAMASAFFHPATREPWGLVINEAMASGLPIVASSNGGAVEELVDQDRNGLVFDPNDNDAMAKALADIGRMNDDELRQWGNRSREILANRMPTAAFGKGIAQAIAFATNKA